MGSTLKWCSSDCLGLVMVLKNCISVALDIASSNFSAAVNFLKIVLSSMITYYTNYLGTSRPLTNEQSDEERYEVMYKYFF